MIQEKYMVAKENFQKSQVNSHYYYYYYYYCPHFQDLVLFFFN